MSPNSMRFGLRAGVVAALLGLGGLAACGGNAKGGLANVPNMNRPWGDDERGRDVIANGPEACGPTRERPVRSKLPQCPETTPSARAPIAPPPRGR
jgi:hypothetical protein